MALGPNPPATPAEASISSLDETLQWYDRAARGNRRAYQALRLGSVTFAAAVPVLTTARAPAVATAIAGGVIVVFEGIQQVFRFHDRYITFRSAWNALDREKRLFESRAGRYADNARPEQTLAERLDEILSTETLRWEFEASGTKKSG
jgi:hypothetical protein